MPAAKPLARVLSALPVDRAGPGTRDSEILGSSCEVLCHSVTVEPGPQPAGGGRAVSGPLALAEVECQVECD